MKRPFLILVFCMILPVLGYSQTDTSAAVRDTTPAVVDESAGITDADSPSGDWIYTASGGWTFPFEPAQFKDHFNTSYNLGEGIAYALPAGDVGYGEVGVMFQYYTVRFTNSGFRKVNAVPASARLNGTPGNIVTCMVQFRGVLGSRENVAPYFTTALGLYHIYLPAIGIVNGAELAPKYLKTTLGWSAGLGLDVPVADRFTLFVDGKFILGVTETNGHKHFTAGGGFRFRI